MSSPLRIGNVDSRIVHVVLDRPAKRNALDLPMFRAIVEAQRSLAQQPGLRVVILRGEGEAFCAGLDVQAFTAGPAAVNELLTEVPGTHATLAQQVAVGWRELAVPVIAVLHGQVFGGGLQIALGADLRVAAADTQLSIMESRWGLIPDMGATATLKQLLPLDQALALTYTARVIPATEALSLGLITRIEADPLAHGQELANVIANKSPQAIAAAKRLFLEAWYTDVAQGLRREAELQRTLIGSPNQVEAVQANLERRAPNFTTE